MNLLAFAADPDLRFKPAECSWKIAEFNTACFEAFPTIYFEAKSNVEHKQIAAYYRRILTRHGWSLGTGDDDTCVHAYRKRSLPLPFIDPLIYRDDQIEIVIHQYQSDGPSTIQIGVLATSHLDFPSAVLIWLTGNRPPLKYIL